MAPGGRTEVGMTRVCRILRAIAAVSALFPAACTDALRDDTRVVFALPSSTLLSTSAFIAEDLGLFEQEGLQVTLRTIVGVGSVNAVLAGSADFTIGTGPTFLRAVSQGQPFVAIANMVDRPLVELVLRRDVAERLEITDDMPLAERGRRLRGLTIGIQGVGSIIHAWVRYVASAGGLNVEDDLRVAPMDPPAMVAALQNGLIDGYATSPPFTTAAVRSGDAVMLASGLTDAPDLLPFAYALVYARPETCVERRDVCARLGRAFMAAARMVQDRPEDVFEHVLKNRFANMDVELLKAAWERTRLAHANDIRVTADQLENSQKVSVTAGLLASEDAFKSYHRLFTSEFVK
jgi:NitT/TauT family transport system substrate-binding protein